MTYFYSLFKNPKKIDGSEGMSDEPIDPRTGDAYDCFLGNDGAWYTFSKHIYALDYSVSRYSKFSQLLTVLVGFDRNVKNGEIITDDFMKMMTELESLPQGHITSVGLDKFYLSLQALKNAYEPGDFIIFH